MNDRYPILRALGAGRSRTWLVQDISQSPPKLCVLKQVAALGSQDFCQWVNQLQNLPPTTALPSLLDVFAQDDRQYLVQEFINGPNLATLLAERGAFTAHQVWCLLAELLPILDSLHQRQIVHGDLKPTNLIQRSSPTATFALVGLGALPWLLTLPTTATTQWGDPEYASPEQLQGRCIPASDLYGLGVTCIHLLTDIRPFDVLDSLEGTRNWQSYWIPGEEEGMTESFRLGFGKFLDRLVAPALHDRFPSAKAALKALQTLPSPLPHLPTPSPPHLPTPLPPSPWQTTTILASVNTLAISPNGQLLASGSEDKTIHRWYLATQTAIAPVIEQAGAIRTLAFSPDGDGLASGGNDRTVKLWHPVTGELIRTFVGHQQAVNTVQFSPPAWIPLLITGDQKAGSSLLISGGADKLVYLWSPETGKILTILKAHLLAVQAIACHPTQPLLATASQDRTIKLWDLVTCKPLLTLTEHTWPVQAIVFSPDGKLLASGSDDNTIRIWEIPSGRCLQTITGHSWAVTSLAFSPDGTTLVSGSWDKTVKLWRVQDGQELAVLSGHEDSVTAVAITPNGRTIVSASKDKTLRLWQTDHRQ